MRAMRRARIATGRITVSAEQAGGEVHRSPSPTTGAGSIGRRCAPKAEAQGLIAEGAVLSDHDLLQLIFHPGFSTAAEVTNLSGRGVGMDVVKRPSRACADRLR
jgi:two-component system chemotaxis sensor kinase CheA